MFFVKTAEGTQECESIKQAESIVHELVFRYGYPEVDVVDENGIPYLPTITLEPIPQQKWLNGICCDKYLYAQV